MGNESAERLEPLLNPPSPAHSQASTSSRNGDSGAVIIQRKMVRAKSYRSNVIDGTKAKFAALKKIFLFLAKLPVLVGHRGSRCPSCRRNDFHRSPK